METKTYVLDKLVRNNDVSNMEAENGVVVNYCKAADSVYVQELVNKLVEEAKELKSAGSAEEILKELADITEILNLVCEASGVISEQVEERIAKKQARRGGFDERNFVDTVICPVGGTWDTYFSKQPEKYGDGTV